VIDRYIQIICAVVLSLAHVYWEWGLWLVSEDSHLGVIRIFTSDSSYIQVVYSSIR
jgi:hypothetical protein